MVLEGDFNDAPPDDNDPYSSSPANASSPAAYKFKTDTLPKPLPILGTLFNHGYERQVKTTGELLGEIQKVLKRPPTQEEAEVVAYFTFQAVSISSYGPTLGIGGGLYRAYSTAGTFRFPFYQPTNINPRNALLWHAARGLAYGVAGWFVGTALCDGYAASVFTAKMSTEPKLKEFRDARRREFMNGRPAAQTGTQQPQRRIPTAYPKKANVDDASPTGGWDAEGDTDSGFQEEAAKGPPTAASPRPWPKVRPVPVDSPRQDIRDQPFDAFEESSPTGAEQGMMEDKVTPVRQTGSAWDKIRKGEKLDRQNPESAWSKKGQNPQGQKRGSSNSDDFAYNKSEEESAYAKDEAQKEFDARVERERRGGDFSKGNGDQKRW